MSLDSHYESMIFQRSTFCHKTEVRDLCCIVSNEMGNRPQLISDITSKTGPESTNEKPLPASHDQLVTLTHGLSNEKVFV